MTYPVGGLAVLYGTLSPGGQIRHFYTDRKPGTHERCPVPLTARGTQALVSFAPLAFKLFFAARQNAVLRRSPFPSHRATGSSCSTRRGAPHDSNASPPGTSHRARTSSRSWSSARACATRTRYRKTSLIRPKSLIKENLAYATELERIV